MSTKLGRLPYDEPPMYLQRPSSGRSQDVTHVLARTFRDLFTRDLVEQETVRNLNTSRSGDDTYHEKYVEDLRKIQAERERRMAEALMLERHIMQARARSMAADERELNKAAEGCDIYHDLGLPPVDPNLQNYLDSDLLRKHGLIVPEDYSTAEAPPTKAPKASRKPRYAEATDASTVRVHFTEEEFQVQEGGGKATPGSQVNGLSKTSAKPWQGTASPQTRERNRTDLAMVHSKADFLRNPRHRPPSTIDGGKSLVKPNTVVHQLGGAKSTVFDTAKKEPSVVFLAKPSTVVFTEYQVGRVYELPLELKNVSAASRPLRVVPPKTQFFSVGLGKFPGEQGIVAPGMSCQYNIRFMPDSLMDFNDTITIQTQSSQPLIVKLQGRRPPPVLSLSKDIDCGHCLVGGKRTVQFLVKNEGGSGRFCLMPRESWPTTNFKSATNSDKVDLAPFVIQPAILELLAGHTIPIQVTFTPTSIKHFSRDLTMICDNCTVKHFTLKGEGQTAGVELAGVSDGGESHPSPGEMCDATAQHQVRFDPINPMTYVTRQLTIKNTTNVELPFHWEILKPHFERPVQEEESGEVLGGGTIQRLRDETNTFCINPDKGVLPPQGKCQANLTFAPTEIGSSHSVLHLILREVPKDRQSSAASSTSDISQEEELTPNGRSARRSGAVQVSDVVGLEVELKGECEEFHVVVEPYAVFVPGQLLVSTTIRKPFQMTNYSKFPAHFHWTNHSEGHIIEVETPQGSIPPESTIDLELAISGAQPGRIDHTLQCTIQYQERTVPLRVIADIKGPEVLIDTAAIDFGLVRFGETVTQDLHIRNASQVAATWRLQESEEFMLRDPQTGKTISEFTLTPSSGDLSPLGSKVIRVTFKPIQCRRIQSVFECKVTDGNHSFVGVRADVQHPQACLLSCHLTMEEVYVGVPVTREVTIVNQTLLAADFCWQEPQGSQANKCKVTFDPCRGRLEPRENLKVMVTFVAHTKGVLDDVKIPCAIEGMDAPLVLALFTDVRGLTVTYKTPNPELQNREDDLLLDFGGEVELGSTPSRLVRITNHTAIAAPFHVAVEYFASAKPPTPPEKEKDSKDSPKKRGLLNRTSNLADPQSRTASQIQADYAKAVLRDNRGAAFVVSPASGVLEPFSELTVNVTAYSDMWGGYTDNLICKVSDLSPVVIPIAMTITGCPLCFSMATLKGQLPIVRFGTHVAGLPPVNRPLKIRNNSPCDIRVDWQIFNLIENDAKLVDLLINIGEPFPLRDSNGKEIVPQPSSPEPAVEIPEEKGDDETATDKTQPSLLLKVTEDLESDFKDGQRSQVKDQLIGVVLREHEGEPTENGPFTVSQRQMVIPARGSIQMAATFNPQLESLALSGADWIGYGLGFMSLDNQDSREVPDKVTRSQGFEMTPLRLDFTAYLKPALLTVETADDEGMRYHTAASDLLHPEDPTQYLSPFYKSHAANLTNATQTPLAFRLITPEPFELLSTEPGSGRSGAPVKNQSAIAKGEQLIGLPPQKNLQIKVAFRLSSRLLEMGLSKLQIGEMCEGFKLVTHEEERRLIIKQDLLIEYSNNAVQKLPLYAMVIIPSIRVTPSQLDFGTCLVSQQRELEVTISNPTGSASFWTVISDPKEQAEELFRVVPSSGFLEAHVTHVSHSKMILKVHFTARHNVAYKGKFIFQGMLGETPQELEVKGQGSYDSRHEALVDV